MLISGNIPFKTEVASVFIFGQIESDRRDGAAAVSVVLLAISLVVLLVISAAVALGVAAMTARALALACASSRSATSALLLALPSG